MISRLATKFEFTAALALTLCLCSSPARANKTVEFMKYLDPVQNKGYRNETQDRSISKHSFKDVEIAGAKPIPNADLGLFAQLTSAQAKDESLISALLDDNRTSGLSLLIGWSELEPVETKFDWTLLDKLLEDCAKHKKTMILRVGTCAVSDNVSDTPKWVFDAGAKSVNYLAKDKSAHQMPIFWDTTYLAKWSNFVNALGNHVDKNKSLHSVGITGGGLAGGTQVVPDLSGNKQDYEVLEEKLKTDFQMNQRQLVQHWKYVADVFPQAFKNTALNFDADPPTPDRAGQTSLDEISDYLVYRYGQRVYLTREDIDNAKHGFDEYRVLLKFRPDTITGYALSESLDTEGLRAITKNALDDGISYVEVPNRFFAKDAPQSAALSALQEHLGYQLISQKVSLPGELKSGDELKASFTFLNNGSSSAKRPVRQFDKDVASSYKIQLEFRDKSGKPIFQSLHTPGLPTNKWMAGTPVSWEESLKTPALKADEYDVYMSLIDPEKKEKLNIIDDRVADKPVITDAVDLGKISVTAN